MDGKPIKRDESTLKDVCESIDYIGEVLKDELAGISAHLEVINENLGNIWVEVGEIKQKLKNY